MRIEASEKEIEDLLCDKMRHYLGLRFVARQIATPAGIVDVLARCPKSGQYWVIELKKGTICPKAYAQVMRYTLYFNHNKNKDGARIFMPMLVGGELSQDLSMCTEYYDEGGGCHDPELCRYRLFDFDPLEGVCFNFVNSANEKYTDKRLHNTISPREKLVGECDYLEHQKWCLQQEYEGHAELKVIEGGK